MAVSSYVFRAFFTLLLTVSFRENATASGFDLTPEELAIIERDNQEREQRELHAAMAASDHDHAAKNASRERLQIEMALAADAHAQRLKQEADDLERALELSRESHRVPAAAAVAAPELSERERVAQERAKRFQSVLPPVLSIDQQVDAAFEKEKNEIQNEIHRLESINLITAYPKPQDRPIARREIDARLTELRVNLQNYTQLGKATATKLRLKSYISSQQRK